MFSGLCLKADARRLAGESFNRVPPRKLKPRLGELAQHQSKLLFLDGEIVAKLRELRLQLID
jgi:hypothetical protein